MSFDFSRSAYEQGLGRDERMQFYAQEAALRSAHAHVVTERNASQLDTQVKTLASSFLGMQAHEKSEHVGARVAQHQGVKALLLQACSKSSNFTEAQKLFLETLTSRVKDALPSEYATEAKRQEKAATIVKKAIQDLERTGAFDEAWSVASARKDALKFADGQLEVAGGANKVFRSLVRGDSVADSKLAQSVAEHCYQAISHLNLRRCQDHGEAFREELNTKVSGSLLSNILSQINNRDDNRASKTAEKIAGDLVESAASKSVPSVKALRHPIAQLWSNLSIANGKMVSLAQVRFEFVKSLAAALHDGKGYSEEDSLRKAEHIFIDLCKGLDEPGVERYTQAYMQSLSINENSFQKAPVAARMSVEPTIVQQHFRIGFEAHRDQLGITDQSIAPKFQDHKGELSAKDVAANILAQADKGMVLWERALFAQEGKPTSEETKKRVKEQLRAAFSSQLAVYEAQKQEYQAAGMFGKWGKSEHAKDPAERYEAWIGNLTDAVCKKLQQKDLDVPRANAEATRDRFGDLSGIAAHKMNPEMVYASANLYQDQALNRYQTAESELSKVIVRAIPTDGSSLSASSLLGAAHSHDLRQLHQAYYARLDTRTDVFGFDLDMSLTLTKALEGSFPATTEGREKCRAFVSELLAHMKSLIGNQQIPGLVKKYTLMRPWKAEDLQDPAMKATAVPLSGSSSSQPSAVSMTTSSARVSVSSTPRSQVTSDAPLSSTTSGDFERSLDAEATARQQETKASEERFEAIFSSILTNTETLIGLAASSNFAANQRRAMVESLIQTFDMLEQISQQSLSRGKINKAIEKLTPWQSKIESAVSYYQQAHAPSASEVPDQLHEVLRLFQGLQEGSEDGGDLRALQRAKVLLDEALKHLPDQSSLSLPPLSDENQETLIRELKKGLATKRGADDSQQLFETRRQQLNDLSSTEEKQSQIARWNQEDTAKGNYTFDYTRDDGWMEESERWS